MSHQAVRNLIRDTALSVRDDIRFYYCRESTFNVLPDREYPAALLVPLRWEPSRNGYTINRLYRCRIIFYILDSQQGDEQESQEALDKVDLIIQQFISKLNLKILEDDPELTLSGDTIELSSESVTERIKQTTENMTGWEYSFSMLVPDQYSYCKIYD